MIWLRTLQNVGFMKTGFCREKWSVKLCVKVDDIWRERKRWPTCIGKSWCKIIPVSPGLPSQWQRVLQQWQSSPPRSPSALMPYKNILPPGCRGLFCDGPVVSTDAAIRAVGRCFCARLDYAAEKRRLILWTGQYHAGDGQWRGSSNSTHSVLPVSKNVCVFASILIQDPAWHNCDFHHPAESLFPKPTGLASLPPLKNKYMPGYTINPHCPRSLISCKGYIRRQYFWRLSFWEIWAHCICPLTCKIWLETGWC